MDSSDAASPVATDPRIRVNEDGSTTMQLREPIKVSGQPVSSLTIRRPKAKALLATDAWPGKVGKGIALVAACSGIAFAEAQELDGDDFALAETLAAGFLPTLLRAGATPSQG